MRAEDWSAAFGDGARDAAGVRGESAVGIQIRDAGNIVGFQRAPGDASRREGDRKHDRFGAEHATAAAFAQLRLTKRRVAQPAEMADLVKRDALEIVFVRFARRRD